jgi:hypothetical protein
MWVNFAYNFLIILLFSLSMSDSEKASAYECGFSRLVMLEVSLRLDFI